MNAIVAIAGDDHRLAADVSRLEGVARGDFAGVGHPDPGLREYPLHLLLEDGGIVVEARVDPVVLDQTGIVLRRGVHVVRSSQDVWPGPAGAVFPRFAA